MIKKQALSHPEIELRPSFYRSSNGLTGTILDLLEVYPDHMNWKEKLDHFSLLKHFRVSDSYVISYNQLSFWRQKTC